jgi:hypothetical protein
VERLASEFHTAELLTPAVWRPACRPAVRGNCVVNFFSDRQSIRRLAQAGAGLQSGDLWWVPASARGGHAWEGSIGGRDGFRLRMPKPLEEIAWSDLSAFSSHEAAEAQLLHPEVIFCRDRDGRAVHAVPMHQYARATVHVEAEPEGVVELLGGLLEVPAQQVEVDHVCFQKRCTHTLFFPPERIPVAAAPSARPICTAA